MDWKVIDVSSLSLSFSLFLWLSTYLPIYLSICLSIYLSVYLSIYPSIHPFIYLYIYLSICLSICLSIYLSLSLSISLSLCLSVYLSICKLENEAILRDFFIFWTWQHPKRSTSARLLQFLNLTTSKTKQFCETSFKHGKLSAALAASYQCVLQFFQFTCLKCCACHEKVMPGHTKCCLHLSRKIILANLQIWCSKMQPLSGNQHPDLLTSLMNMSFVLRLPRDMHLCRSSSNDPRLPSFLETRQNPHVLLTFEKVHNPLRLPRPKVARTCGVFNILTSTCASRHNGVHFFDISTSKSGLRMVCF